MHRIRARLDRRCYVGTHRTFLTFCTHSRRVVFDSAERCDRVLADFLRACDRDGFEIPAYCFMPDHVHAIVGGTRTHSDLVCWITMVKQLSAVTFSRTTGQRLWQEGWFDRVVRNSDEITAIIRYMIENPIRAGLVSDVRDYPYWGSSAADIVASQAVASFINWFSRLTLRCARRDSRMSASTQWERMRLAV